MAILAIVFAFIAAPLGIVFGAIGRSQIRKTGQQGKGLATAGLVLGIVFTLLGVAGVVTAVVVAGSNTAVPHSAVESEISDQIQASGDSRPDSVSCPKSLKAEVGASMDCTVTSDGSSFPVTVTVTSVEGDTAHFSIKAH
ncbi:MAG: DUF4333 domain-containing protein [Mycobacteriaceae bacterium]|jgi:hypothetical protein